MAAPNIVNVTTITGYINISTGQLLVTTGALPKTLQV